MILESLVSYSHLARGIVQVNLLYFLKSGTAQQELHRLFLSEVRPWVSAPPPLKTNKERELGTSFGALRRSWLEIQFNSTLYLDYLRSSMWQLPNNCSGRSTDTSSSKPSIASQQEDWVGVIYLPPLEDTSGSKGTSGTPKCSILDQVSIKMLDVCDLSHRGDKVLIENYIILVFLCQLNFNIWYK